MSGFYLDKVRAKIEELEVTEQVLVMKLEETLGVSDDVITISGERRKRRQRPKTHTSRLRNDHFLSAGMEMALEKAKIVSQTNKERLEDEIESVKSGGLDLFYKNYQDVVESSASKNAASFVTPQAPLTAEEMRREMGEKPEPLLVYMTQELYRKVAEKMTFSGEEFSGRCLDLHSFYHSFVNLFQAQNDAKLSKIEYIEYLDRMGIFSNIDYSKVKVKKDYEDYLKGLFVYLKDFHERSQPLVELNFYATKSTFEEKFLAGALEGWESKFPNDSALLEFSRTQDPDEVFIKNELRFRGLKIGGRQEDRKKRLKACLEASKNKLTSKSTMNGNSKEVNKAPNLQQSSEFNIEAFLNFAQTKNNRLHYPTKQRVNGRFDPKRVAFLEFLVQFLISHLGKL